MHEYRTTDDVEALRAGAHRELATAREAIALNPNTPDDVLQHLAGDSSPSVRRIAAERLAGEPTESQVASSASTTPNAPPPRVPDGSSRSVQERRPQATAEQEPPWASKLIAAQVATAHYLRAGLMLAFTLLAFFGFMQQGNAAESRKALECMASYRACDDAGGLIWYLLAVAALIIGAIAVAVFAGRGTRHLERAER